MPREHGEKGEFVETITLGDVLEVFDDVRGPVVLSADVADRLECSRETARRKLERLYDRGELDRRKVARRVIYWRPDGQGDTAGRVVSSNNEGNGPSGPSHPTGGASRPSTPGDPIGEVLEGWEPDTQTPAETARAQTRRVATYLRERGGRHTKSDLVDALADDSTLSDRVWWERAVRPGLQKLDGEGLVEYRPGHHDYQYIGEEV